MKKKSYDIFSITQGNDESVEEYIRRFRKKKLEFTDCSSLIVIEAFMQGLLRSSNLFSKLTTIVPHTMEEAYNRAKKIVTMSKISDLKRRRKLLLKLFQKKKQKGIILDRMVVTKKKFHPKS